MFVGFLTFAESVIKVSNSQKEKENCISLGIVLYDSMFLRGLKAEKIKLNKSPKLFVRDFISWRVPVRRSVSLSSGFSSRIFMRIQPLSFPAIIRRWTVIFVKMWMKNMREKFI